MFHVVHASPSKQEKTHCHGPCHVISVSACNMSSVSRLSCNQLVHFYLNQKLNLLERVKNAASPRCHGLSIVQLYIHVLLHRFSGACIMYLIILAVKNFSVHLSTLVTGCHDECRNKSILPRRELLRATRASACTHSAIEILFFKIAIDRLSNHV